MDSWWAIIAFLAAIMLMATVGTYKQDTQEVDCCYNSVGEKI